METRRCSPTRGRLRRGRCVRGRGRARLAASRRRPRQGVSCRWVGVEVVMKRREGWEGGTKGRGRKRKRATSFTLRKERGWVDGTGREERKSHGQSDGEKKEEETRRALLSPNNRFAASSLSIYPASYIPATHQNTNSITCKTIYTLPPIYFILTYLFPLRTYFSPASLPSLLPSPSPPSLPPSPPSILDPRHQPTPSSPDSRPTPRTTTATQHSTRQSSTEPSRSPLAPPKPAAAAQVPSSWPKKRDSRCSGRRQP